jgi:hypothetical protein
MFQNDLCCARTVDFQEGLQSYPQSTEGFVSSAVNPLFGNFSPLKMLIF